MKTLSILTIFVLGVIGNASAQVPTGGLTNGLVAYYPLNGNASDAVGGHNGTIYGATPTADRFGNLQAAMSFDGVNNYIDCGSLIPAYENATISVWALVRKDCMQEAGIVAQPRPAWGTGFEIRVNVNTAYGAPLSSPHTLAAGFNNWFNNIELFDPSFPQTINVWHHHVLTAGNGFVRYYLNGVKVGEENFSIQNVSSSDNLVIGAGTSGYHYPGNYTYFDGIIDNVGIWNRALTADEVLALYRAQSPVYEVTLTTKSSTNLNEWTGILTNKVETYNPTEFYKNDISVTIKPPAP